MCEKTHFVRFRKYLLKHPTFWKLSNRLKSLTAFIQAITDKSLEEVAQSIDYSRSHFTKEVAKGSNKAIEKLLLDKYKKEMDEFFQEKDLFVNEDPEDYSKKLVDTDELLVHNSILLKGMIRVLLRNQAMIISYQSGEKLSVVLKKIEKAVKEEIEEDFSLL